MSDKVFYTPILRNYRGQIKDFNWEGGGFNSSLKLQENDGFRVL